VAGIDIVEEHRRRNDSTRDGWETMSSHRSRVMQLITAARGNSGRSLCVFGAGNANDIDLEQLTQEFKRIALVDLDDAALERAASRLSTAARQRIELHGGFDLTGIVAILATWQAGRPITDAELMAAAETAAAAETPRIGRFDVVASTCVLSQLIDSIYVAAPTEHPLRQQLVFAVRNRHLQMLAALVEPGGAGVLVTDFVSAETAPELANLSDGQIPAAAAHWINLNNFFTGANPYAIRDHLRSVSLRGVDICNVEVVPAWRWDIGAKQLAVSAATFQVRAIP
jgi:hypothetical protein